MSTKGFHSQGTAACCVSELLVSNISLPVYGMRMKMETGCGMTKIFGIGGIRYKKKHFGGIGIFSFDLGEMAGLS